MIKAYNDLNGIAEIWCEAFGDTFEDVKYFFENLKYGKCFAYIIDGKAVSLLFLVDCSIGDSTAKYIYAACTLKQFRGMGYMSRLLSYVCSLGSDVCLIPADERLVTYYKQRGFEEVRSVDELNFFENDVINNDYLIVGCSLKEPIVLLNTED
ncbi:GNAT family N-acetyltransferase [uncultured Eubacterium sp.]|uniref:GNAT family N-acetyltransferase n=1 Tax=uncultured Eubacterium sp. TaxID=165185 RepID=UPI0015B1C6D7|nr:hypothetical protein [uncultured Eubacterium sp.]